MTSLLFIYLYASCTIRLFKLLFHINTNYTRNRILLKTKADCGCVYCVYYIAYRSFRRTSCRSTFPVGLREQPRKLHFPLGDRGHDVIMISWAHPSPQPKRHLGRFSLFAGLKHVFNSHTDRHRDRQTDGQTDRPRYMWSSSSHLVICIAMRTNNC